MKEHYIYDELYGTLLYKNRDDTEILYFCIECEYWKFYKWMFYHGWNKIRNRSCERNGLTGYEVTLTKSIPTK